MKSVVGTSVVDIHAAKKRAGKINPTKGKRWLGRCQIPGTRRFHTKAWESEEQAWAWATDLAMKMKLGLDNGQKCSLRGIKDEYLSYLAGRNCAPSHVLLTRQVLDWAIQSGINDLRSDRLAAQVDSWVRNLKARKVSECGRIKRTTQTELSARTKNSYVARIKAAVAYAHKRGYLPSNRLAGIVEKVQEQKRLKAVFTIPELKAILDDKNKDELFFLPFVLSVYAGLRVGEAIYLEWQDILWSEKRIKIRIKNEYRVKFQKERLAPLPTELADLLRPVAKPAGWIVPERLHKYRTSWIYWFDQLLLNNKIDPGERSPHSGRHTWACLSSASKVDAFELRELAGHSALSTTLGYCGHTSLYREMVKGWEPGDFRLRRNEAVAAELPKVAVG